jgi:Na+-driven multidrug efflux pump
MENLPIYFAMIYLLSFYGICNGIIKGLGMQYKASIYTVLCLYVICLPLSFVLGFHPEFIVKSPNSKLLQGLPGIFLGFSIGMLVLDTIYIYLLCSLDWKSHS